MFCRMFCCSPQRAELPTPYAVDERIDLTFEVNSREDEGVPVAQRPQARRPIRGRRHGSPIHQNRDDGYFRAGKATLNLSANPILGIIQPPSSRCLVPRLEPVWADDDQHGAAAEYRLLYLTWPLLAWADGRLIHEYARFPEPGRQCCPQAPGDEAALVPPVGHKESAPCRAQKILEKRFQRQTFPSLEETLHGDDSTSRDAKGSDRVWHRQDEPVSEGELGRAKVQGGESDGRQTNNQRADA
jgi:hypothetical protein